MRNAELAVFGAEHLLHHAKEAQRGAYHGPEYKIELQFVKIGDVQIIAVQGETFVEYALAAKALSRSPKTFFLNAANGATAVGYICTPESLKDGGYETGTTLLAPDAGEVLTEKIKEELKNV